MQTKIITPNPNNLRHNPFVVQAPYDGIYAHGVETSAQGRYLHVSGQLGFNELGGLESDFQGQAEAAINNVERVLLSAGMSLEDLVQMRFYLVDRQHVDTLVNVRMEKLNGLAPAVTTYLVGGLLKEEWLIEIEALAFRPDNEGDTQ